MGGHSAHDSPETAGPSLQKHPAGPKPWLILALAVPGLVLLPLAIAASVLGARYRRLAERDILPESSAARAGYLLGATGVLLGMIQVCAFLYLLPVLLHGWKPADQAAAVSTLRRLCAVQSDYRKLTGACAPNLDVLEQRGFISSSFGELRNYRLEMKTSSSGQAFEARAISSERRRPSYFIDQTGVLRWSDGIDVGPDSPAVSAVEEATR
jgi:hypothetical protein